MSTQTFDPQDPRLLLDYFALCQAVDCVRDAEACNGLPATVSEGLARILETYYQQRLDDLYLAPDMLDLLELLYAAHRQYVGQCRDEVTRYFRARYGERAKRRR